MTPIHRYNLNGGLLCGAKTGKVSTTGAGVTCLECLKLIRPIQREAAAARTRRRRESEP